MPKGIWVDFRRGFLRRFDAQLNQSWQLFLAFFRPHFRFKWDVNARDAVAAERVVVKGLPVGIAHQGGHVADDVKRQTSARQTDVHSIFITDKTDGRTVLKSGR